MVEGSKRVEAAGNPNGQESQSRTKERALRDVPNKLEAGSINFKPAWSGRVSVQEILLERE